MDKISEDLEDAARRHISKILYWHVNQLRGNSQSRLIPVKDKNGPQLVIRKELKKDWKKILRMCLTEIEYRKRYKGK